MKTQLFLTTAILSLSLASCDKEGNTTIVQGETTEGYIVATSPSTWHYYSFSEKKVIGSADESAENNAVWGARGDWDIAVQQYKIRTNSGEFTTAGADGGVYSLDINNKDGFGNIVVTTAFGSVQSVPAGAEFVGDKAVTATGMGGVITTIVHSKAVVVQMKKNADGLIMPPVYIPAAVYVFRSADGKSYYKVQFTQYQNENKVSGHVRFDAAQIYK